MDNAPTNPRQRDPSRRLSLDASHTVQHKKHTDERAECKQYHCLPPWNLSKLYLQLTQSPKKGDPTPQGRCLARVQDACDSSVEDNDDDPTVIQGSAAEVPTSHYHHSLFYCARHVRCIWFCSGVHIRAIPMISSRHFSSLSSRSWMPLSASALGLLPHGSFFFFPMARSPFTRL